MNPREIPRSEWSSFFDSFSRMHEGWLIRLEEIAAPAGPTAVEARGLPLLGASYDHADDSILIAVGGRDGEHLTRDVPHPSRVIVEQNDEGIDEAVRIEEDGGQVTRVSFRSTVRPEEVDGVPNFTSSGRDR
jgi:uncharacterized protein DUF5335